jgi:hypothetical protein
MNELLRSSKSLKYLALFMFCVEFLTPVFFFTTPEVGMVESTVTHFQDHKQATLTLASLFAEETFNEGEREGSRSKDQVILYEFQFSFFFLSQHESIKSVVPFVTQNQLHRVMPPLYKLHCLLLI